MIDPNEAIKKFAAKVREMLEAASEIMDQLDEHGMGVSNYIPDSKTRDVFELSLKLFGLYLASADGNFDPMEAKFIHLIFGETESIPQLKQLAEKSGVTKDEFGDQAPLVLNCAIDFDNKIQKIQKDAPSVSQLFYEAYSFIGSCIIIADQTFTAEEYNRYLRFMKTMYKKIGSDLNVDLKELLPPQSIVRKSLTDVGIGDDKINAFSRPSRKYKDTVQQKKEDENKPVTFDEGDESKEPEESLEQLLDQLNELVGLNEVKYEVTSLINLCRIKKIREENGMTFPALSLHLVFTGNPGTGKTTVARLLAKIYRAIGVLSKGHMVEVDRAGLVGGYVGQTALKVQDVIQSAVGGVLFIDEAYALTNTSASNDYGVEAIDTLVKAMEDNRNDLIVIVAGYPEQMQKFITSNPGLKSRFNKYIHFADYDPDELVQVFKLFCQNGGYRASLDALEYVHQFFVERCANKPEDFANAREVRNLFEQAMMRQANRIILVSDVTPETLSLLKKEDVSGEIKAVGKSEQLAQIALRGLSKNMRMGIAGELMDCPLDELELSARALLVLGENKIKTLGQIIDHLESGKKLTELSEVTEQLAEGIYEKLIGYGYNGPVE